MKTLPVAGLLVLFLAPLASHAQDAPPPSAASRVKTWLVENDPQGGPNRAQRLALGILAAACAATGAVVGASLGLVAVLNPDCLEDTRHCLNRPSSPDLSVRAQVDGRQSGERRLLLADISFVTAAALAVVAVAAFAAAVWPFSWWPMVAS